eukprot:1182620-Prorocentrum_minimum.AAC.2
MRRATFLTPCTPIENRDKVWGCGVKAGPRQLGPLTTVVPLASFRSDLTWVLLRVALKMLFVLKHHIYLKRLVNMYFSTRSLYPFIDNISCVKYRFDYGDQVDDKGKRSIPSTIKEYHRADWRPTRTTPSNYLALRLGVPMIAYAGFGANGDFVANGTFRHFQA